MIKVVKKEFIDMDYSYDFTLENGDTVNITEKNYDTVMSHISKKGLTYRAIVNEHEDNFEEAIEYIGFILIK